MSDLGPGALEAVGQALAQRFGALNVWTAVLLGGALALDRALSRRTRASFRVALYAPVALRVLLPLDWSLRIAGAPRAPTFLAPLAQIAASPGLEASAARALPWHALVAVVYVFVLALLAAHAVRARVRLGRALAGARPVPGPHGAVPCPVVEHDDLGPLAVGLLGPRVVVPRRLLVAGEEHTLACVLRHEAAHLRRRDGWLSVSMQVLAIAAWPVVPLWLAIARVRQLVELACDEAALAGADATERRRYGHALLDMAEWRTLSVAPLGAGALHFGSTLRARIEALASQRQWPPAAQALALSLAALALIVVCSGAAAPPAAAPAAPGDDDRGYGYQFEADPATSGGDPSGASLPAGPDGRLPPETIQATVRARFGAFRDCYAAGLKRDPKLTGVVSVKFVFGEDGVTKTAADEGSTLPDEDLVRCVVDEFRKLTYPKASGGEVTVVYPLLFAP